MSNTQAVVVKQINRLTACVNAMEGVKDPITYRMKVQHLIAVLKATGLGSFPEVDEVLTELEKADSGQ